MNSLVLIRALSGFLAFFAIPSALCAAWAFANDHYEQASLFILVVTTSVVMSGVFSIATQNRKISNAKAKDVVGFLMLAWGVLAILGSLPFLEVSDFRPAVALFEAVSCATTTGTSLLDEDTLLPASVLAWRGVLHIVGAALSIGGMIMVVRLVGSSVPGLDTTTTALTLPGASQRSFFRAFWAIGSLLLALSSVVAFFLLMDGHSMREAYGLAVSAITTGQVFPIEEIGEAPDAFSRIILIIALLLGSLNAILVFNIFRTPMKLLKNYETLAVVALIFILSALIAVQLGSEEGPLSILAISTSIVSTSGILIAPSSLAEISVPTLLFFGFIGGAAISATGGMKIYRMLVLLSQTGREFSRLAQPNAVANTSTDAVVIPSRFILTVWAYLVAFAVLCIGFACLYALLGANFEQAIISALGAITNSAVLLRIDWVQAGDMPALAELILSFCMILGRLELLLLASLLFSE